MEIENFRGQVLLDIMPQKVDWIDRKILYILSKNCRISNTALAKALKLRREVVTYRINQLVNKKIITGFFTLLDTRKLGFMTFNVFIKLTKIADEQEIIRYLINNKEVTVLSSCGGRYDLYFDLNTNTLEEFEEFMNNFQYKYYSAIKESVVLNFLKEDPMGNEILFSDFSQKQIDELNITELKGSAFNSDFHMQENTKLKMQKDPASRINIDQSDRKILSFLKFNARATLKEISDEVKMSPATVKSKIKIFVANGIIKSFTTLISFSSLGYQWFMVFFNMVNIKESKWYSYMKQHKNIEWCIRSIGPWNYQFSVFARNNKEFYDILNEIRNEFKEEITHYEFILIFNQFKFESRVE